MKGSLKFALFLATIVSLGIPPETEARGDAMATVDTLRQRIEAQGYQFTVGETWVLKLSPEEGAKLRGFTPIPLDLTHLTGVRPLALLPSSLDWRDAGGVTPVKNQGVCGSCWAFAALGDLESKVLIEEEQTLDLSEQNLLSCNFYGYNCALGGNPLQSTNHLAKEGGSLESCAVYMGANGIPCKSSCQPVKKLTEWRLVAEDTASIKSALYQYGPMYTAMYSSDPAFSAYTGGVYDYGGSEEADHAVLIAGWDDSLGENGAWIVKNSWGTGWGMDGYFHIAYGAAQIGTSTAVVSSYADSDPSHTLFSYDEGGLTNMVGYGAETGWGAVRFTPTSNGTLRYVHFWTVSTNASYQINIYDGVNGGTMGNLLTTQSGACSEFGYYRVELSSPVLVTAGDDFVVAVRFVTPGFNYPVPADDNYPLSSNASYLSPDGNSWTAVGSGTAYPWDLCIGATVESGGGASTTTVTSTTAVSTTTSSIESTTSTASSTSTTTSSTTTSIPNSPPHKPSNPSPSDEATAQPTAGLALTWSGGDPDEGDQIGYDLYLGETDHPPKVCINQPDGSYSCDALKPLTTYYWKVVAKDSFGAHVESDLWSFTTAAGFCPIALALKDTPGHVNLLRTFREKLLGQPELKKRDVDLYYDHAFEIARLMIADPRLRERTRDTVEKMIPAVRAFLRGDRMPLPPECLEAALALLGDFETRASSELSIALQELKDEIRNGRILYGIEKREAN